jgi:hypothetical protein
VENGVLLDFFVLKHGFSHKYRMYLPLDQLREKLISRGLEAMGYANDNNNNKLKIIKEKENEAGSKDDLNPSPNPNKVKIAEGKENEIGFKDDFNFNLNPNKVKTVEGKESETRSKDDLNPNSNKVKIAEGKENEAGSKDDMDNSTTNSKSKKNKGLLPNKNNPIASLLCMVYSHNKVLIESVSNLLLVYLPSHFLHFIDFSPLHYHGMPSLSVNILDNDYSREKEMCIFNTPGGGGDESLQNLVLNDVNKNVIDKKENSHSFSSTLGSSRNNYPYNYGDDIKNDYVLTRTMFTPATPSLGNDLYETLPQAVPYTVALSYSRCAYSGFRQSPSSLSSSLSSSSSSSSIQVIEQTKRNKFTSSLYVPFGVSKNGHKHLFQIPSTDILSRYHALFPSCHSLYLHHPHFISSRPELFLSGIFKKEDEDSMMVPDTPLNNILFQTYIEVQVFPCSLLVVGEADTSEYITTRVKPISELKVVFFFFFIFFVFYVIFFFFFFFLFFVFVLCGDLYDYFLYLLGYECLC